jgi:hypothetical protein
MLPLPSKPGGSERERPPEVPLHPLRARKLLRDDAAAIRRRQRTMASKLAAAVAARGEAPNGLGVAAKLLRVGALSEARKLLEAEPAGGPARKPRRAELMGLYWTMQGGYQEAARSFARAGRGAALNRGIALCLAGKPDAARALLLSRGQRGRRIAAELGLLRVDGRPLPAWHVSRDPQEETIRRLAGWSLRGREEMLGRLRGPDRRLVRVALSLIEL